MASSPNPAPDSAWSDVVAWLILAFRAPSHQGAEQLTSVDINQLLRKAGLSPEQPLPASFGSPADWMLETESEYVRLFVNSKTTPVAHLEALAYIPGGEQQTAFLRELQQAYAASGFQVTPGSGLPADHLTIILEHVYLSGSDNRLGVPYRRFLDWIPRFQERLAAAQPPPFYRAASEVLTAVVRALPDP